MKRFGRFGTAMALAAIVASGLALNPARLEAKGKGGKDPQATVCAYLLSVINYEYVGSAIQAYAISLYIAAGCDASLLP